MRRVVDMSSPDSTSAGGADPGLRERLIFHMCRAEEWEAVRGAGFYYGSSQDVADGFIHLCTAIQLARTAARHRAGQTGLVLLTVDSALAGSGLVWEASATGGTFPHCYGPLPVTAILRVDAFPLGPDGQPVIPAGVVPVSA